MKSRLCSFPPTRRTAPGNPRPVKPPPLCGTALSTERSGFFLGPGARRLIDRPWIRVGHTYWHTPSVQPRGSSARLQVDLTMWCMAKGAWCMAQRSEPCSETAAARVVPLETCDSDEEPWGRTNASRYKVLRMPRRGTTYSWPHIQLGIVPCYAASSQLEQLGTIAMAWDPAQTRLFADRHGTFGSTIATVFRFLAAPPGTHLITSRIGSFNAKWTATSITETTPPMACSIRKT